ncbi:hypothetical protein GZ176_11690 [Dermatophilus congolensis]|uniref:hypothetical protein n=1 Tax=Dermatophilus congolensis TaxID=1863 RepID=UPI001AAE3D19|nr:hypothetical protein [Dermatophilus congolensis]MBO3146345.1 hypothetical protein [Dermatophilus congolensis]MBO3148612.1 hypothetical protein [Dermatophilus congolensis]MBO3157582.1 hypothetical protein [Dermatophilus congolensis]MBO3159862.1 hypothetical protein [Dermatophilus congolensis]MBO3166601.1 hypothetical protein [Dermatophilus congolensis]
MYSMYPPRSLVSILVDLSAYLDIQDRNALAHSLIGARPSLAYDLDTGLAVATHDLDALALHLMTARWAH